MADADDLSLIPRSLRDKLDRVGIKLHLKEWETFTLPERRRLIDAPCESATDVERFRSEVSALVRQRAGHEPDLLR
jgi:hypothetical protein